MYSRQALNALCGDFHSDCVSKLIFESSLSSDAILLTSSEVLKIPIVGFELWFRLASNSLLTDWNLLALLMASKTSLDKAPVFSEDILKSSGKCLSSGGDGKKKAASGLFIFFANASS